MKALAWMSFASSGKPSNSSAPRSGAVAPPLTEPAGPGRVCPSMSTVTPVVTADTPPDSSGEGAPLLRWRFVLDTNGAAEVDANDALSFVAAALNVFV